MNRIPDVSIIVCGFNHEKWIERCIRSLNHQVYISQEDYEILVVDDGSTDNTQEVLNNLSYVSNLRIIKNETNLGLPTSLNKAIKQAGGRYVVRVDSDDYVSKFFLFFSRTFLDMNRNYQAVATDYIIVDQFENILNANVNCFDKQIACGVMFRKECLFDVGLYNETFKMREGHELRQRFEAKFKIARLEFPLYKYRQHNSNRTNNKTELEVYDQALKG